MNLYLFKSISASVQCTDGQDRGCVESPGLREMDSVSTNTMETPLGHSKGSTAFAYQSHYRSPAPSEETLPPMVQTEPEEVTQLPRFQSHGDFFKMCSRSLSDFPVFIDSGHSGSLRIYRTKCSFAFMAYHSTNCCRCECSYWHTWKNDLTL